MYTHTHTHSRIHTQKKYTRAYHRKCFVTIHTLELLEGLSLTVKLNFNPDSNKQVQVVILLGKH